MQGPNFVCIGAQKAGTTWLYENLNHHPDVWMPPVKEFHYFNRVCANKQLLGDWDMPHPDSLYRRYFKNKFPPKLNKLRWLRHYYRSGLSKSWYQSLFADKYTQGKICGEITPGYSTLDNDGVGYAHRVLGDDTTIIFILRNPIDRSWSAAKMMFRYYRKEYGSNDYDEIITLLKKPHIMLCSDYVNIIQRWRRYYPNMHIMTYDRLSSYPGEFLGIVSEVLGIQNVWNEGIIGKRVWGDDGASTIPSRIRGLLLGQYGRQMEELYALTGLPDVKRWIGDK